MAKPLEDQRIPSTHSIDINLHSKIEKIAAATTIPKSRIIEASLNQLFNEYVKIYPDLLSEKSIISDSKVKKSANFDKTLLLKIEKISSVTKIPRSKIIDSSIAQIYNKYTKLYPELLK